MIDSPLFNFAQLTGIHCPDDVACLNLQSAVGYGH